LIAAHQENTRVNRLNHNALLRSCRVVGERDAECPAPQSYEFWHALRTLGVPTQLVIYPGEGHLFVKPENQAGRLDQTVAWFDKYLQ
jgi:dipeptidyl aminopeptidase/acylaminoacyl peptidase